MLNSKNDARLYSKKDLLYILLFLIIFLFMFKEFFFTGGVFFERDSTLLEIPTRKLCTQLLREGNFALWTDAHGNGQPFLANPKNGVFYPTTLLYLILPLFTAFKLHYLLHVILGWLGLYYLCRSNSLSLKASFLGASLFIFSGIYLSSFEFYNHIASLAWMFWILLVLSRPARSFPRRLLGLAALWSLLILSGTPHVIVMTAIFSLLQSVFSPEGQKRKVALATASLGLSLFICAAQLLPSFELMKQADRQAVRTSEWSTELVQLVNLAFPGILGDDRAPGHTDYWARHLFDRQNPLYYSLYMGFGALLLMIYGFRKPRDGRQLYLISALCFFFLLSCGKYLPLSFLFKYIPFFSTIRYPVKFLVGTVLALSLLSAVGFDNIVSGKIGSGKPTLRSFVVSGSCLILYFFLRAKLLQLLQDIFVIQDPQSVRDLNYSLFYGLLAFVVFSALLFLISRFSSHRQFFAWAFLALALADIICINKTINSLALASSFDRPSLLDSLPAEARIYRNAYVPEELKKEKSDLFRVQRYFRQTLYPYTAMGDNIFYVYNNDFYGVYNSEYNKILGVVKKSGKEDLQKFLDEARCDVTVIQPMPRPVTKEAVNIEGFPVIFKKTGRKTSPVYLVHRSLRVKTLEEKISTFLNKDFNPAEAALVEEEIRIESSALGGAEDQVIIEKQAQGEFHCWVETAQTAIAIFPGNYAKGWKATVDGKARPVFKVNLTSKGVLVGPGNHEIRLRYFPASFLAGVIVSIITLAVCAGFILLGFFSRQRKM